MIKLCLWTCALFIWLFIFGFCVLIDLYGLCTVVWIAAIIYSGRPEQRPKWTKSFALTKSFLSGCNNTEQKIIQSPPQPLQEKIPKHYICNCRNCGAPIYDNQQYCEYCDSKVAKYIKEK